MSSKNSCNSSESEKNPYQQIEVKDPFFKSSEEESKNDDIDNVIHLKMVQLTDGHEDQEQDNSTSEYFKE